MLPGMSHMLVERIQQLSYPLEPKPTAVSERLTPLPQIRTVLFDVYGTLFISGSGDIGIASEMSNQRALTEALECAGCSGQLEEAGARGSEELLQCIKRTHVKCRTQGISYPEVDICEEWHSVLSDLHNVGMLQGGITPEIVQRLSVEYECRVNPVWPMPDVRVTLNTLRDQHVLLGIVSNAQFYTLLMFPAFLGQSYQELGFLPELCAWSFEIGEAKPSVKMFQGVVEHLDHTYGIMPEETLYVGNDMLNDVWTASRCGLKTALFVGDQRSLRLREQDSRCMGLQPDVIITNLAQLPEIVGVNAIPYQEMGEQ